MVIQVDRGYVDKSPAYVKTDEDVLFRNHMRDWFYSFTSEISSKEMEIDSLAKMERYISDVRHLGTGSDGFINFTDIFRIKSFQVNLYRMCQRHYVGIPAGFEASNSFTESENARLYRGPTGARANNKLHVAGGKLL